MIGVTMILPTLLVSAFLTYQTREAREEFIHNLAVSFWICANSVWMIGEFFFQDHTRHYAVIFFALGLLTLMVHYIPQWLGMKRFVPGP